MTDPIVLDLLSLGGLDRACGAEREYVALDQWFKANGIESRRVCGDVCTVTDTTISLVMFDVDAEGRYYRAGDDISKRGRSFPLMEPLPQIVKDWVLTHPYQPENVRQRVNWAEVDQVCPECRSRVKADA